MRCLDGQVIFTFDLEHWSLSWVHDLIMTIGPNHNFYAIFIITFDLLNLILLNCPLSSSLHCVNKKLKNKRNFYLCWPNCLWYFFYFFRRILIFVVTVLFETRALLDFLSWAADILWSTSTLERICLLQIVHFDSWIENKRVRLTSLSFDRLLRYKLARYSNTLQCWDGVLV